MTTRPLRRRETYHGPFLPHPEQDDFNQELQVCIAEALYDVDSIVADPGAYTKEELATLHSQIVSNLEWVWEISGGSEDQLTATMMQISQVVARGLRGENEGGDEDQLAGTMIQISQVVAKEPRTRKTP